MQLSFYGAAETVTGSCYVLECGKEKLLIDCGMFQGSSALSDMNKDAFGFNANEIENMILTHAHIDHSGRIPKLVKEGFSGVIYSTEATKDLCDIMLADSAYIQQNEAEYESRKNKRKGISEAEPLYTIEDAEAAMRLFVSKKYGETFNIGNNFKVRFSDAGHMLGAAITEIWATDESGKTEKIVFSGDLGNDNKPLLNDPTKIEETDYLVLESTYGSRNHTEKSKVGDELLEIIMKTYRRGGTLVIPVFAVGRAQEILYELNRYKESRMLGEAQDIRVVIDSPLAIRATEIFKKHYDLMDSDTQALIQKGDDPLIFENLSYTLTTEESIAINADSSPKIILSASGMCDAGRVRHHIKHNIYKPECTILFVGYQAEGSLGRLLIEGEKSIKLFGERIAVNAEIDNIDYFSGHADHDGLVEWVNNFKTPPKQVVLVHGETDSLEALSYSMSSLEISNVIAKYQATLKLGAGFVTEGRDVPSKAKPAEGKLVPKKTVPTQASVSDDLYAMTLSIADRLKNSKKSLKGIETDKIKLFLECINDVLSE